MPRTPKIQPSTEAAAPARRGRKPKAAGPSPELPLAAGVGSPATDHAGAGAPEAGPTKAPGRRGPGRKPKQGAGAEIVPAIPDHAVAPQAQTSRQPEAEASPDPVEDDAPTSAATSRAGAAADSDPAQPDFDPGKSADEAARPPPEADGSVAAKPAVRWDRTTDRVQFDWPVIERVAAQGGPNQGMAKLLIAARAEGAQSRWPF